MYVCIRLLGMLSTEKEINDALDDKQVRDMTKSQLSKVHLECSH